MRGKVLSGYSTALDDPKNRDALRALLSIDKEQTQKAILREFCTMGFTKQDYDKLIYDIEHCPKKLFFEE